MHLTRSVKHAGWVVLVAALAGVALAEDERPKGAVARWGTSRFAHETDVRALRFTPRGTLLAMDETTVIEWETATGKELRRLERPSLKGWFTADGELVRITDEALELIEISTGAVIGTCPMSPDDSVEAISRDGLTALVGATMGGLIMVDVKTGRVVNVTHDDEYDAIAVGPGVVATVNDDVKVTLHGAGKSTSFKVNAEEIDDIAFSNDALVLRMDKVVEIRDAKSGALRRTIEDGRALFGSEAEDLVCVDDWGIAGAPWVTDGRELRTFSEKFVAIADKHTIHVYERASQQPTVERAYGPPRWVKWLDDGRLAISGFVFTETLDPRNGAVSDLGKQLNITGLSADGATFIRPRKGVTALHRFTPEGVAAVATIAGTNGVLSDDGKKLLVCGPRMTVVDLVTGQRQEIAPARTEHAAFSPDGELIVARLGKGKAAVFKGAARLWEAKCDRRVEFAFSHDGALGILTAGELVVHDALTGRERVRMKANAFAFGPRGLVYADDKTIHVHPYRATFEAKSRVRGLAYGERIASIHEDTTVLVWDVPR